MAEQPSAPTDQPEKTRRQRGALNQEQIDALNKADLICSTAQQPEFAAALGSREIDAAFLGTLRDDIAAARRTAGSAIGGSASRESATDSEERALAELTDAIREIQKAAKQKYSDGDEAQLANYYIGERLSQRARIQQIATAIADRLAPSGAGATPADTLTGINADKITRLRTLLQSYNDTDAAQGSAGRSASDARKALEDQLDSINKRRRKIQFAADAEWPHTNDNNAATRRAFQLPPNRPYNV